MNTERRQSGYIGEGQGFREISDALAYSKLIGEKFFECVHAYAVQLNLNPTSVKNENAKQLFPKIDALSVKNFFNSGG